MPNDINRIRIKREASNPLVIPPVPKIPDSIKKQTPKLANDWDRFETALDTWGKQIQQLVGQAIMSIKLDPFTVAVSTTPDLNNADIQLQISGLSQRITSLSNELTQLFTRVTHTETTVSYISAPFIDGLNLKANKAGDVFTGTIQAPLLVLVSEDSPFEKVGLYMTGTDYDGTNAGYSIAYRKMP